MNSFLWYIFSIYAPDNPSVDISSHTRSFRFLSNKWIHVCYVTSRLVFIMSVHVTFYMLILLKIFSTYLTCIQLFSCVNGNEVFQMPILRESFSTYFIYTGKVFPLYVLSCAVLISPARGNLFYILHSERVFLLYEFSCHFNFLFPEKAFSQRSFSSVCYDVAF